MSAYAAVLYLHIEHDSECYTRILTAKTRVAPLSTQSIPRLELLAALLLAKLSTNVIKALSPEITLGEPTCYTDSKVALYWIKGRNKERKQFVDNRVVEIRRLVPGKFWKHCPGRYNPADLPSRGLSPSALKINLLLWKGPDWLTDYKDTDEDTKEANMPEDCISEIKRNERTVTFLVNEKHYISSVLHASNYHSLGKLLRVTAFVLRIVKKTSSTLNIHNSQSSKRRFQELRNSGCLILSQHSNKKYTLYNEETVLSLCGKGWSYTMSRKVE